MSRSRLSIQLAAVALLFCGAVVRAQLPDATHPAAVSERAAVPPISEEELQQQLLNKTFYLRDGYLGDSLHFDENGKLDENAPRASFTLSLVEITRVRLSKHRLELEGVRYGLHFLGALASEDQSSAFDRVRLTSNKKPLRISIDRVEPEKTKKKKIKKDGVAPPAMRSGDAAGNASKTDPNEMLRRALDRIFAAEMDERMMASLPEYWQLYYKAGAAHSDYRPADSAVRRQNQVDRKAKLLTIPDPPSNEFAQANGVAGVAMYHVIVGPDGKAEEIAVGRPIGFGLDENAVVAIRKAHFEPALKAGKPVPVELDVVVQFRIYSKLTAEAARPAGQAPSGPTEAPVLPGPYSVPRPR